ncbi:type II secretion system F family protein [uncultured Oscillibacter sp.]|uniref:type II secretion system F family protein n=1 Tax=uncultured Oscillibacter sp. TaxID=876091 RepID=UPI0025D381D8|nr:type II secretion system F family protein [uncultured Oscillibacter sp.]
MKRTLSYGEIAEVSLELSLLLHAGVGTGDALYLLGEDSPHKKLLSAMADEVDGGAALASAMRSSAAFPTYACGLVEVGERTGRTEEALAALSRYYEDRVRMDRRVRSALLYPAVMLALMLVVIGVLLVKVLPIFDDVYASLGTRLTGVAAGLLTMGRWLEGALPVFWAVLAALVLIGFLFTAVGPLRRSLVSFWQRGHGDRGVSRKLNNARLAQAMAMGMASGLPLEEALGLSAGLVEGGARRRCEDCRKRLDNGEVLSAALKASGLLPASQSRLLELGQRGGVGDASMEKIARDLSEEGEAALDAAVSRVEPALVLLCSVLVGLILLSVMLPLMHIMSAIG